MNKKLLTGFMAAIMAAQLAFAPISVNAAQVNEKVKISTERAVYDAMLHRTDSVQTAKGESKQESKSQKPVKKAYSKNNKPNRLAVTIKGDPSRNMAFNWYTSDKLDSVLKISKNKNMDDAKTYPVMVRKVSSHFVERDNKGYFIFQLIDKASKSVKKYFTDENREAGKWSQESEIKDKKTEEVQIAVDKIQEYSYKAEADDLKPNTVYYYQVGSKVGGMSEVGTFKTASDKNDKFGFLHYTDTQNAYWNEHLIDEGAYSADTIRKALKTHPEAGFVLHTGDIVEIAEVEDEWSDLFEKSKDSFMKTPLAVVSGNHDEYGINYDDRFLHKFTDHFNVAADGPDDGGVYYSYDYNGVHFIVLNTNDNKNEAEKALGEDQMAWIKYDAAKARANGSKWIILCYHKPLFSKSYHSLQDNDVQNVRDEFMKLIDECDIDIALQGHDHVLSRTKSLKYVPKTESVFNAKVADKAVKKDGIDFLKSPAGTTFVLPNTGGTKAYDDIYDKGLDHVIKVRPKLDWLTPELLKEYNSLFAFGEQPQKSPVFEKSHSNNRDSKVQNFAYYEIDGNTLSCKMYQIEGDIKSERTVKVVDSFTIQK